MKLYWWLFDEGDVNFWRVMVSLYNHTPKTICVAYIVNDEGETLWNCCIHNISPLHRYKEVLE